MKNFYLFIFFLLSLEGYSQKQGNIWYFGEKCGLDFNSGSPVILTNGRTGTDTLQYSQEGTSSIADSTGALVFYTGGKTIWKRNHMPMVHGSSMMGGPSSTQSSLIVPLPGSDRFFIVFTSDEFQSYLTPPERGYRYSVVDMCIDKDDGDVMTGKKNILLLDSATEKLAACEDAGGTGYWIVGHKMFSDEFYSWHLTSAGIIDTVISKIGTIHGWKNSTGTWNIGSAQGQMKISPSGNKLALAISNFDPAYLDLFDFNNNTGSVSNFCHMVIDSAMYKRVFGVEFSPDNTKLYATLSGGSGGKRIYQYNLTSGGGNCDSIQSSRKMIFQSDANSVMFGMQLAPNGKIYLVGDEYDDLGCINYPNLSDSLADYDSSAVILSGTNNYTLPSFIAGYKYHNNIACPTITLAQDFNSDPGPDVYPNPAENVLHILFSKEIIHSATAEIMNIEGKVIGKKELCENHSVIDISEYTKGMYFVRVINENGSVVKKFIKQ
jgi:hypothetical protein